MDFRLTKEQEALKKEFEDFFREEMKNAPACLERGGIEAAYESDEGFAFHQYMKKKLGEKGWISRAWPKEYGGQEGSLIEQLIFSEVRMTYRAPGIDGWGVEMFAPTLLLFGTEEQKRRLLPPIAKGEVQYCQGWSEPDAGSDLANLGTSAVKDGDHYVINGQKIWTTGAQRADRMFMLARTDPDSTRSRGLSVFHVQMDYPGIEVRPLLYMDRRHIYNEVFFKDVRVPEADRVGPEGDGWKSTRETMNFERSGIGAFAAGKRILEEIIEYAQNTNRDGKPLSDDPIVRRKLAQLHIDIEAGHSLSYNIAWLQQKGGMIMAASAASEAKVFGSELSQRIANYAMEIMGLYGQVEQSKWSPLGGTMVDAYMYAPGGNIAAGSSEIQRNLIAWVGLGLPRFK
ncbi:acyl-CoA dehydrogenase family protein [Thermodesulfobacteriota bacterium]